MPAHIDQSLLRGCGSNDALAASKLSPSLGVAPVDSGWEVNFPAASLVLDDWCHQGIKSEEKLNFHRRCLWVAREAKKSGRMGGRP